MSTKAVKRRCAAVRRDGRACRGWAVVGREPALCAVHAGLNVGGGGQVGNRNAMKHGLYMGLMNKEELKDVGLLTSRSVGHELVLARVVLGRLVRYLKKEDLPLADALAVAPVMSTLMRTVARLANQLEEGAVDWDVVLDALEEEGAASSGR